MDDQPLPPSTDPVPETPAPDETPTQSGWIQPSPDQGRSRVLPVLVAVVPWS